MSGAPEGAAPARRDPGARPLSLGAVVLSVALTAGACGHVVWRGHDPDWRKRVEVIERLGRQWVRIDGKSDKPYRGIGIDAMVFAPGGRRAYPARMTCGWAVVIDGLPGRCWDGIASIRFGPRGRRLVYVAQRGRRWHAVIDGVAGPAFTAIHPRSVTFSDGGRRVGYVARRGDRAVAVIDGRANPAHDAIGQLRFGPTERHVAYVARDGGAARVVVDGAPQRRFAEIRDLRLLRDGRVRYLARQGACWQLAGRRGTVSDATCHGRAAGLTVDPSGVHVGYVAGDDGRERVVVDGSAGSWFNQVSAATLRLLRDGRPVYAARAGRAQLAVVGTRRSGDYSAVEVNVSADGRHWGYVGQRSAGAEVVVDDQRIARHPRAGGLVIAGGKAAYLSRGRAPGVRIHHGRRAASFDLAISGTLVLDDRGEHWGCLVGRRSDRTLHIAVDGRLRRLVPSTEIVAAATVSHPPLSKRLRRWVAAELRRVR